LLLLQGQLGFHELSCKKNHQRIAARAGLKKVVQGKAAYVLDARAAPSARAADSDSEADSDEEAEEDNEDQTADFGQEDQTFNVIFPNRRNEHRAGQLTVRHDQNEEDADYCTMMTPITFKYMRPTATQGGWLYMTWACFGLPGVEYDALSDEEDGDDTRLERAFEDSRHPPRNAVDFEHRADLLFAAHSLDIVTKLKEVYEYIRANAEPIANGESVHPGVNTDSCRRDINRYNLFIAHLAKKTNSYKWGRYSKTFKKANKKLKKAIVDSPTIETGAGLEAKKAFRAQHYDSSIADAGNPLQAAMKQELPRACMWLLFKNKLHDLRPNGHMHRQVREFVDAVCGKYPCLNTASHCIARGDSASPEKKAKKRKREYSKKKRGLGHFM
jgi:hypothetical protein